METRVTPDERHFHGELADIKLIGAGGMSQIFRAWQPSLDRFIVIKKLKDSLVGNPETVERFRREARALAAVLHQNVAHVYDFVETGGEPYLLMEYIEGIDVSTVIEKVGHIPPRVAAAIMLGVAKGVSHIHTRQLIHRDIKPSNIRLTNRGDVKLMDFGIVVDLGNEGLTRPGMMVGSPSYLSPEQVLGDPITPSADIFLMGISLYEMLTGTRPFKDEAGQTVFQRIREVAYVPVRKMQPQVPAELDRIVRRCLQREPAKRFADVKDLIAALERFVGHEAASHTEDLILGYLDGEALIDAAVPFTEVQDRAPAWRELLAPKKLVLVLAVAALLLAGGFWLGRRTAGPAPAQDTAAAATSPYKPPAPLKRQPQSTRKDERNR